MLDLNGWALEGSAEHREEKADVTPHKLSTTLFAIMTFLALVTVAFEKVKDFLMEEVANHDTKPVITGLFSELTVLGFLSLVTFVVSQINVLEQISGAVFGEGEEREGYLEELLEKIHFLIFAIMVIFIFQSLVLLRITNNQLATWKRMNALCSGENTNKRKDIDEIIDWLSQVRNRARSLFTYLVACGVGNPVSVESALIVNLLLHPLLTLCGTRRSLGLRRACAGGRVCATGSSAETPSTQRCSR